MTREAHTGTTADPLALCRQDIDRVDAMLVALLRERTRLALDVGRIKRAHGLEIAHPARETDVLTRVRDLASGPLDGDAAARIFAQIISEMRAAQMRGCANLSAEALAEADARVPNAQVREGRP